MQDTADIVNSHEAQKSDIIMFPIDRTSVPPLLHTPNISKDGREKNLEPDDEGEYCKMLCFGRDRSVAFMNAQQ